jgi:hypothetical protein
VNAQKINHVAEHQTETNSKNMLSLSLSAMARNTQETILQVTCWQSANDHIKRQQQMVVV